MIKTILKILYKYKYIHIENKNGCPVSKVTVILTGLSIIKIKLSIMKWKTIIKKIKESSIFNPKANTLRFMRKEKFGYI